MACLTVQNIVMVETLARALGICKKHLSKETLDADSFIETYMLYICSNM